MKNSFLGRKSFDLKKKFFLNFLQKLLFEKKYFFWEKFWKNNNVHRFYLYENQKPKLQT